MAQSDGDALTGLAPLLRVTPELQDLCWFSGSWASPHAPERGGWAPFHFVTRGRCVLERKDVEPIALSAGDVIVLPHADAHVMRSTATSPAPGAMRARDLGPIRLRTNDDGEAETEIICGRLRFERQPAAFVLKILPRAIVMRVGDKGAGAFQPLVLAVRDEVAGGRPGARAIATDLASALLVMVLRAHLDRDGTGSHWLSLVGEPSTARAVAALVQDPARDWALDEIAETAMVSRATLVRAFHRVAGVAPRAFLTELRLSLARQRLQAGSSSIARIAADVGYESESAFSRAFQKRFGIRPGGARDQTASASRSAV